MTIHQLITGHYFLSIIAYVTIRDEKEGYMPIYEYWCRNCQKKVVLYLATFKSDTPLCPHCNKDTLYRLFSTFAIHKTDNDLYEDILNDSSLTKGMLDNNPQALAEWNRRMSRGEKVAPEYEQTVKQMEKGETSTLEDTGHISSQDKKSD
jgi:putative FmdB family regulatory protein